MNSCRGEVDGAPELGGEAHARVIRGEEAVVGEADAVGVAAEVAEDLRGHRRTDAWLDDPVLAVELALEAAERARDVRQLRAEVFDWLLRVRRARARLGGRVTRSRVGTREAVAAVDVRRRVPHHVAAARRLPHPARLPREVGPSGSAAARAIFPAGRQSPSDVRGAAIRRAS
jgi:hypothetical protein